MPINLRIFRVFVASPRDLQPEREALESAIVELNQTTGSTLGLRLELVRWETSTYPSIGQDPQAIVNEQLADSFDIFIGILWCRLGQPTPRAESGTVEEFERALARRRENPSAVEIMIYFKDAPIPPSKIDAEQLQSVQSFRRRVTQEGLTSTFSSTEEFLTAIRIHLTRVLQGWDSRSHSPEQEIVHNVEVPVLLARDEEPGFLDLIQSSSENFALSTSATERVAGSISILGAAARETTAKLAGTKYSTQEGISHAKRIFNSLADQMAHFSEDLRSDTSIIGDTFGKAIQALQASAEMLPGFQGDPSDQLDGSINMLASMEETIQDTRVKLESFRHTVEGTPRITTQYNRAKRSACDALERFEAMLESQLRLVSEARKLQQALLESYRQQH